MAKAPHVLVVEDEAALADLLKYNLEKEGYRVSVANDGEEALVVADENPPDLVVLDWMLPKAPGIEVCRRLRARQQTRNTPIVMLTARTEESDRIRGLDIGADDYITKPFSMSELLAACALSCAASGRPWPTIRSRAATSSSIAPPIG